MFDKIKRKSSLNKEEKLNNEKENEFEIGFYMKLADDMANPMRMKDKGDLKVCWC